MYYYLQEDHEFFGKKGTLIYRDFYNLLPSEFQILFGKEKPVRPDKEPSKKLKAEDIEQMMRAHIKRYANPFEEPVNEINPF